LRAVPALLALLALTACGGEQERRSQPAPKGDPGLKVWAAQGCGSCHTFAPAGAAGDIGPDLAVSLRGKPDEYILEGIIAPAAAVAPAYDGATMPDDFAERIPRPDLKRLVDFIAAGVR
jgi:mono/diheme cytochrome c family protein